METNDLTIELLRGIREEGRKTNERIDQTNQQLESLRETTNERLDQTNLRLDSLREELSRRIVDSEVRTATAITSLAGDVRSLTAFLRETQDLRPRVTQCEDDIKALKRRIG
jgi:type I site-specific restriction endonuclease